MTSTHQITRTVRTRAWRDVDPKVAAAAALASVATLVLGTLLLAGRIGFGEFATTVGTAWGVVGAGYLKRSAETVWTVREAADTAAKALDVVGPVVVDAVPAAAPTVAVVEDGVAAIRAQLDGPPPASPLL